MLHSGVSLSLLLLILGAGAVPLLPNEEHHDLSGEILVDDGENVAHDLSELETDDENNDANDLPEELEAENEKNAAHEGLEPVQVAALSKREGRSVIGQGPFQLYQDICGTTPRVGAAWTKSSKGGNKIVGGTRARKGQFPWQVSLYKVGRRNRLDLTCGGTLISPRTVLTASHCIKEEDPPIKYEVWVGRTRSATGSTLWDDSNVECTEQRFQVVEYFKHPDFDKDTLKNDVAILSIANKYKQGACWSDWVLPACLATKNHPHFYRVGAVATVSGFGLLDEKGREGSESLMFVNVEMANHDWCKEAYKGKAAIAEETQICAGTPEGGKDACAGDSGGPLVIMDGDRWHVMGVVSFGMGCGRKEFPGVYARVDEFLPWIQQTVESIEGIAGSTSPTTQPQTRPPQTRPSQTRPSQTRPPQTRPPQTRPPQTRPPKTRPPKTRPPQTRPPQTLPPQTLPPQTLPPQTRPPPTLPPGTQVKKLGPVCERRRQYAFCPVNYVIRVTEGFYGRANRRDCDGRDLPVFMRSPAQWQCSYSEARAELAKKCNGQRYCNVREKLFSERPCRGKQPYIKMQYGCLPLPAL